MNKVKTKDIYFKVEIWIDFRESDHSTQYFKTKEEQDNVLTSLKQSFVNAINQSYIDSKERDDAVVNTIAIGDLKFENHHNEPQQNFAHKKKTGGGGGGPGGYSKAGRGGSRW